MRVDPPDVMSSIKNSKFNCMSKSVQASNRDWLAKESPLKDSCQRCCEFHSKSIEKRVLGVFTLQKDIVSNNRKAFFKHFLNGIIHISRRSNFYIWRISKVIDSTSYPST